MHARRLLIGLVCLSLAAFVASTIFRVHTYEREKPWHDRSQAFFISQPTRLNSSAPGHVPLIESDRDIFFFDRIYYDEANKFLYCYIPKNGCTAWKRIFFHMFTNASASASNESDHRWVHDWLFANGTNLNRLQPFAARATMVMNDPHVTRVVVVRDPIARFLSGFRNKCDLNDVKPYDGPHCPVRVKDRRAGVPLMDQVIEVLERTPVTEFNDHFMPQFLFCGLRLTWQLFMPIWFDEMEHAKAAVLQRLAAGAGGQSRAARLFEDAASKFLTSTHAANRLGSHVNTQWTDLTRTRFERLVRIYQDDYRFFNLPVPGTSCNKSRSHGSHNLKENREWHRMDCAFHAHLHGSR